jgi:hypothetical protein
MGLIVSCPEQLGRRFLSVGAGAIFQVVYSLITWISHHQKPESSPSISAPLVAGFITGLLIMYFTGLLI